MHPYQEKESRVKRATTNGSLNGWVRAMAGCIVIAGIFSLTACDVDSYMDPTIVGRWESTPVVMPILDRLDVIEEPEDAIPGLSQIRSEDLIPEVSEYVLGPGDLVTVTVFELISPGVESVQTRRIDELGFIRLPIIGQVKVGGLTSRQLEDRIVDILDPEILRNPMVSVVVQEGRQKTFNIRGAVGAAGTYSILQSDFRLLDAISLARDVPAQIQKIYVIRQVPLSPLFEEGYTPQRTQPGEHAWPTTPTPEAGSAGDGESIEDIISGALEPGMQEEPQQPQTGEQLEGPLAGAVDQPTSGQRWVRLEGRWVPVEAAGPGEGEPAARRPAGAEMPAGEELPPVEQLVTQRVIEVDAQALLKGDARQNVVIRPGDIIRVPGFVSGNVYVGGQVARPGTYALPGDQPLTLQQVIIAAGGLNAVGIPERVDLIRRVGDQSQATVRLNLRAIFEGVQPDIFLKPNDQINVGTNLPAPFLAVIRNSFRMTYGFGFLLDRNFGNDVFGAPPDR
jgi:polysaccharide export outer membrane protein